MEDTEKRILESAREQFAQYGYQKTSLDDIVRDVKISKGTIYNYFKNKEDLFRHVAEAESDRMLEHLKSVILDEPEPSRQMVLYVLQRTGYIRDFFSERGSNLAIIKELLETLHALESENPQEIAILKEIVRQGEGKKRFKMDSVHNVEIIYAAIRQFELRWIQMKPREYTAEIEALFDLMLRGIKA